MEILQRFKFRREIHEKLLQVIEQSMVIDGNFQSVTEYESSNSMAVENDDAPEKPHIMMVSNGINRIQSLKMPEPKWKKYLED